LWSAIGAIGGRRLLVRWANGDSDAMDALMPLVYDELHRMARRYLRRERGDLACQTTSLVHDAYLRLVDQREVDWRSRAQFFGLAAAMMRRVLVDRARRRGALKRGAGERCFPLDEARAALPEDAVDMMALHEALEALEAIARANMPARTVVASADLMLDFMFPPVFNFQAAASLREPGSVHPKTRKATGNWLRGGKIGRWICFESCAGVSQPAEIRAGTDDGRIESRLSQPRH
jgi:RNA polymerase sigma factor (TIGR02999 family)